MSNSTQGIGAGLVSAVQAMAETLSEGMTAAVAGPALSCQEADSVALVLAVAGHREEAAYWLLGHAEDELDSLDLHTHFGNDAATALAYVDELTRTAAP